MAHQPLSTRSTKMGVLLLSLLLLAGMLLAACGGGTAHSGKQVPLTIQPNDSGDWANNFNPFSGNVVPGASNGTIYETLLWVNRLTGDVKPWLADSYQFSSDARTLTFHLHKGVQWSDGQLLTSDDVVFTLQMIKKYSGVDVNGVASYLKSVTAPDASTVTIQLTQPYSPALWFIGGQTYIVPRHIWSTIKGDPSQYADTHPVGSGPYVLKSFTPQLVVEVKNPHYWQPGKPAVNELRFPAYDSNNSAELALIRGDILWTGLYIPNIQRTYINRDQEHNHYWFPVSDVVMLYLNLTKPPFNQLAVRQAISAAIDRQQIYKVGESGYEPVAHPTALLLPFQNKYLASDYASASFSENAARADQYLQSAGFTKGADGVYADKSGKKLSFKLEVPSGWTDWITDCQIIQQGLKAAGINVSVTTPEYNTFYNDLQVGKFDMALWGTNPGPSPYYLYYGLLASANSAPAGQSASSNFERWQDSATDSYLNQYSSTLDPAQQEQALAAIQKIMVEQLPAIPLMNEPYWDEYSTKYFTGWPDAQHPYAVPSPYNYPDNEIVILNLKPVS